MTAVRSIHRDSLHPDPENPRERDPARMAVLAMSLNKLGFILPMAATADGKLLSGHQRLACAVEIGYYELPVQIYDVKWERGINMMFNRCTNDMHHMDTGRSVSEGLREVIELAEELPDWDCDYEFFAMECAEESIRGLGGGIAEQYDRRAVRMANSLLRQGVRIPIVVDESGNVVNGAIRLFSARESGETRWPLIQIPDEYAAVARGFLNFLSMDYSVNEQFATLLRYSAYRRPQNSRGALPKSYRFFANGYRTLADRESYSTNYWQTFRTLHGRRILDFGSGLSRVRPFLNDKGFDCTDFEPYRIDPDARSGFPSPDLSKRMAREFLQLIADPEYQFDSIFLNSVLNSIPFPRDRQCVLSIVHALCSFGTTVYGTCRDYSDFVYEYAGLRQATYFVFDSEPGVRIGDSLTNPKVQKFHTTDEFTACAGPFWADIKTWPGGNIFYWRCRSPKRINPGVLREALEFEFDLPYDDGTTMGLVTEAVEAFSARLKVNL